MRRSLLVDPRTRKARARKARHGRRPGHCLRRRALGRKIDEAVKNLDDLEFRIIELRYGLADGHSHTHDEVARTLAITPEKVQQIEAAAVAKLQQ